LFAKRYNLMPFLELFDETLDINATENYELSVQVSSDDLSFCILDTLRNKFVLLRSYEPEDNSRFDPYRLNEIIKRDDFLTRSFRKALVITPSFRSTLVPAPLFDDSKKEDFLAFNQISSVKERILTNKLKYPEIIAIFSLPEGTADIITSSFPRCAIMHPLKPLFQYINFNKRPAGNYIQIHFEHDFFTIVIFDPNELTFCNAFHYKNLSDIEYYVLYVLKRMNIGQNETVYLSGRTVMDQEVLRGMSDYLSNIRFALPQGNYTFSYVLNETELYKYLVLFSAVNCE